MSSAWKAVLGGLLFLALCLAGCQKPQKASTDAGRAVATILQEESQELWMRIGCWMKGADEHRWEVYLTCPESKDAEHNVANAHKLLWMHIGQKIVLPGYFTWGDSAQKIPGNKLEEAWKARTPGVFKIDYALPILQTIFPGKTLEVDGKILYRPESKKLNPPPADAEEWIKALQELPVAATIDLAHPLRPGQTPGNRIVTRLTLRPAGAFFWLTEDKNGKKHEVEQLKRPPRMIIQGRRWHVYEKLSGVPTFREGQMHLKGLELAFANGEEGDALKSYVFNQVGKGLAIELQGDRFPIGKQRLFLVRTQQMPRVLPPGVKP